jgi:hypothetical protein
MPPAPITVLSQNSSGTGAMIVSTYMHNVLEYCICVKESVKHHWIHAVWARIPTTRSPPVDQIHLRDCNRELANRYCTGLQIRAARYCRPGRVAGKNIGSSLRVFATGVATRVRFGIIGTQYGIHHECRWFSGQLVSSALALNANTE